MSSKNLAHERYYLRSLKLVIGDDVEAPKIDASLVGQYLSYAYPLDNLTLSPFEPALIQEVRETSWGAHMTLYYKRWENPKLGDRGIYKMKIYKKLWFGGPDRIPTKDGQWRMAKVDKQEVTAES